PPRRRARRAASRGTAGRAARRRRSRPAAGRRVAALRRSGSSPWAASRSYGRAVRGSPPAERHVEAAAVPRGGAHAGVGAGEPPHPLLEVLEAHAETRGWAVPVADSVVAELEPQPSVLQNRLERQIQRIDSG